MSATRWRERLFALVMAVMVIAPPHPCSAGLLRSRTSSRTPHFRHPEAAGPTPRGAGAALRWRRMARESAEVRDNVMSSRVRAWDGFADAHRKGSALHGASLARAIATGGDLLTSVAALKEEFKAPERVRDTDREFKVLRVERATNLDPKWTDFQNKFYMVCTFPATGIQFYSSNMEMDEDLTKPDEDGQARYAMAFTYYKEYGPLMICHAMQAPLWGLSNLRSIIEGADAAAQRGIPDTVFKSSLKDVKAQVTDELGKNGAEIQKKLDDWVAIDYGDIIIHYDDLEDEPGRESRLYWSGKSDLLVRLHEHNMPPIVEEVSDPPAPRKAEESAKEEARINEELGSVAVAEEARAELEQRGGGGEQAAENGAIVEEQESAAASTETASGQEGGEETATTATATAADFLLSNLPEVHRPAELGTDADAEARRLEKDAEQLQHLKHEAGQIGESGTGTESSSSSSASASASASSADVKLDDEAKEALNKERAAMVPAPGSKCEAVERAHCQDTSVLDKCSGGSFKSGMCPGANNVKCCVPGSHGAVRAPTSACETELKGTCIDQTVSDTCATGPFVSGKCPGKASIKCCPGADAETAAAAAAADEGVVDAPDSKCVKDHDGAQCLDTGIKPTCEGGEFKSGLCPGLAPIKCCVPNNNKGSAGEKNNGAVNEDAVVPAPESKCAKLKSQCFDTDKAPTCEGGEYRAGLCPGASNVKCCATGDMSSMSDEELRKLADEGAAREAKRQPRHRSDREWKDIELSFVQVFDAHKSLLRKPSLFLQCGFGNGVQKRHSLPSLDGDEHGLEWEDGERKGDAPKLEYGKILLRYYRDYGDILNCVLHKAESKRKLWEEPDMAAKNFEYEREFDKDFQKKKPEAKLQEKIESVGGHLKVGRVEVADPRAGDDQGEKDEKVDFKTTRHRDEILGAQNINYNDLVKVGDTLVLTFGDAVAEIRLGGAAYENGGAPAKPGPKAGGETGEAGKSGDESDDEFAKFKDRLIVTVNRAQNLTQKTDFIGKAPDAYAIVTIAGRTYRTPAIHNSVAPAWERPFVFPIDAKAETLKDTVISIRLMDSDTFFDDYMGDCDILAGPALADMVPVPLQCEPVNREMSERKARKHMEAIAELGDKYAPPEVHITAMLMVHEPGNPQTDWMPVMQEAPADKLNYADVAFDRVWVYNPHESFLRGEPEFYLGCSFPRAPPVRLNLYPILKEDTGEPVKDDTGRTLYSVGKGPGAEVTAEEVREADQEEEELDVHSLGAGPNDLLVSSATSANANANANADAAEADLPDFYKDYNAEDESVRRNAAGVRSRRLSESHRRGWGAAKNAMVRTRIESTPYGAAERDLAQASLLDVSDHAEAGTTARWGKKKRKKGEDETGAVPEGGGRREGEAAPVDLKERTGYRPTIRHYAAYGEIMSCALFESDGRPVDAAVHEPAWYHISIGLRINNLDTDMGHFQVNRADFAGANEGKPQTYWTGDAQFELSSVPGPHYAAPTVPPHRVLNLKSVTIHEPHELAGKLELYLTCSFGSRPGSPPQIRMALFPVHRSQTGWWSDPIPVNRPMLRLYSSYTPTMLCAIYETDGAPPLQGIRFQVGPLLKWNIDIGGRDQPLGQTLVNFAEFEDVEVGGTKSFWVGQAEFELEVTAKEGSPPSAAATTEASGDGGEYKEIVMDWFKIFNAHWTHPSKRGAKEGGDDAGPEEDSFCSKQVPITAAEARADRTEEEREAELIRLEETLTDGEAPACEVPGVGAGRCLAECTASETPAPHDDCAEGHRCCVPKPGSEATMSEAELEEERARKDGLLHDPTAKDTDAAIKDGEDGGEGNGAYDSNLAAAAEREGEIPPASAADADRPQPGEEGGGPDSPAGDPTAAADLDAERAAVARNEEAQQAPDDRRFADAQLRAEEKREPHGKKGSGGDTGTETEIATAPQDEEEEREAADAERTRASLDGGKPLPAQAEPLTDADAAAAAEIEAEAEANGTDRKGAALKEGLNEAGLGEDQTAAGDARAAEMADEIAGDGEADAASGNGGSKQKKSSKSKGAATEGEGVGDLLVSEPSEEEKEEEGEALPVVTAELGAHREGYHINRRCSSPDVYLMCAFPNAPAVRINLLVDPRKIKVDKGSHGVDVAKQAVDRTLVRYFKSYGKTMTCTVMRATFDSPRVLFEVSVIEMGRVKFHSEGGRVEVAATGDLLPASLGMVINSKDKMLGQFSVNYDDLSDKVPKIHYWTGDSQFQLRLAEGGAGSRKSDEARKYKVLNLKSLRVFEKVGSVDTANLYMTCKAFNGPPFRVSLYPVYGADTGTGKEPINFDGKEVVRLYEDYGVVGCSLFSGSAAPPLETVKVGFGPALYSMSIAADARPLGSIVIDYHDTVRKGSVFHYFTGVLNVELELVDTNESEEEAAKKAAEADWKDITLQGLRVFNDEELIGDLEIYATCSFSARAPPIRIDFANVGTSTNGKLIRPGETCRGPYCEGLDGAMPFVRWQREYGDHMKCAVVERDPEPPANNYALSLTELAKIKVAVGSRDTLLGQFVVHYDDMGEKTAPRERSYWTGDTEIVLSLHKQSAAGQKRELDSIASGAVPEYKEIAVDWARLVGAHDTSANVYIACDYPGAGETRINLPKGRGSGAKITFENEHQPDATSRPFARFYRSYGSTLACVVAQRVSKLPIKHFSGGVVIDEDTSAGFSFDRLGNGDARVGVQVTQEVEGKDVTFSPVTLSVGAEDPILGSFVLHYEDLSASTPERTYWVGEAEVRLSLGKISNVGGRFSPADDVVPATGEAEEPAEDPEEARALEGEGLAAEKTSARELEAVQAQERAAAEHAIIHGNNNGGAGAANVGAGSEQAKTIAQEGAHAAESAVAAERRRELEADQARVAAIIAEEKGTRNLQAVDRKLEAAEAREESSGGAATPAAAGGADVLLSAGRSNGMGSGNNGKRVTVNARENHYSTGDASGGVRHVSLESINVANAREGAGQADIYMVCAFSHGAQVRVSLPTKVSAEGKEVTLRKPLFSYYSAYGPEATCHLFNSQGDPPVNDIRVGVAGGSAGISIGERDVLLGTVVVAFSDFAAGDADVLREYWFGDATIVLRSWSDLSVSPFVHLDGAGGGAGAAETAAAVEPGSESQRESDAAAPTFVELRLDSALLRNKRETASGAEVYINCQAGPKSPSFRVNIPDIGEGERTTFEKPLFRFYRSYGNRLFCSFWEADGESLLTKADAQYKLEGYGAASVSTSLDRQGTRTYAASFKGTFADTRDAENAEAKVHDIAARLAYNNGDDFLGMVSIGFDDFDLSETRTYESASLSLAVTRTATNLPESHTAPRRDLVLRHLRVMHDGEAESRPEVELRCAVVSSGRAAFALVFPAKDIGKRDHALDYPLGSLYPAQGPLYCTLREIDEEGNIKSFELAFDGYKLRHTKGLLDFTVPQLHSHSLLKNEEATFGIPYQLSAANLGDFFLSYGDFGTGREEVTVWTGSVEMTLAWVDHRDASGAPAVKDIGPDGTPMEGHVHQGGSEEEGDTQGHQPAGEPNAEAGTDATENTDAAVSITAVDNLLSVDPGAEAAMKEAMEEQKQQQQVIDASAAQDPSQSEPVIVDTGSSSSSNSNNNIHGNGNANVNVNVNHNANLGNAVHNVGNNNHGNNGVSVHDNGVNAEAHVLQHADGQANGNANSNANGNANGNVNNGATATETPAWTPEPTPEPTPELTPEPMPEPTPTPEPEHGPSNSEESSGDEAAPGSAVEEATGKWVWLEAVRALTFKDKFLSALDGVEIAVVCQHEKFPKLPITFLVEVPRQESKHAKLYEVNKPLFVHQEAYGAELTCQVVETDGTSKFKAIAMNLPHIGKQELDVIELKDAKLGSFKLPVSSIGEDPVVVGTKDVEFTLKIGGHPVAGAGAQHDGEGHDAEGHGGEGSGSGSGSSEEPWPSVEPHAPDAAATTTSSTTSSEMGHTNTDNIHNNNPHESTSWPSAETNHDTSGGSVTPPAANTGEQGEAENADPASAVAADHARTEALFQHNKAR